MLRKLADGREETGQRLARAGRGDEQRAAAAPRQLEHLELVTPRPPAFGLEPAFDDRRKRSPAQSLSVPSRRRSSSSA
jgi:hypothetical protein